MIEEAEYVVRATLMTVIGFSPIERDRTLTQQDAIDNAISTLPDEWFARAEDEGWSIEFHAERQRSLAGSDVRAGSPGDHLEKGEKS